MGLARGARMPELPCNVMNRRFVRRRQWLQMDLMQTRIFADASLPVTQFTPSHNAALSLLITPHVGFLTSGFLNVSNCCVDFSYGFPHHRLVFIGIVHTTLSHDSAYLDYNALILMHPVSYLCLPLKSDACNAKIPHPPLNPLHVYQRKLRSTQNETQANTLGKHPDVHNIKHAYTPHEHMTTKETHTDKGNIYRQRKHYPPLTLLLLPPRWTQVNHQMHKIRLPTFFPHSSCACPVISTSVSSPLSRSSILGSI